MLIGTAGHVDHGKTTLVRALTGVDCDRLDAEKKRGITIELGFARWHLPDGRAVSIVDVPGHERLVRTMLVGAGGMDAVLLVVAADAGVMPQTREHLAACGVLGISRGIVVITCADRVDDIDAAVAQIRGELQGSFLESAPFIPVSALQNTGLDVLADAVGILLDTWTPPAADLPVYLPVDRVFTVEGFGTVVTGSLVRGQLAVGDALAVIPGPPAARIRGVHVHGNPVAEATAGQRVALNLAVPKAALRKGVVLATPNTLVEGRVFDAEIQWCAHAKTPLTKGKGFTVHLGAARALAELRCDAPIPPGGVGTGRVRLDRAIPVPPGGRFVLRGVLDTRFGGVVGGGRVLDAQPPRKRKAAVRLALAAGSGLGALVNEAARRGIDPTTVALRLPCPPMPAGPLIFSPVVVSTAAETLLSRVVDWHQTQPDSPGMPAAMVLQNPLQKRALEHLGVQIKRTGQLIHLPTHRAALDPADAKLGGKIMRAVGRTGLNALTLTQLLARFPHATPDRMARVLRHLARTGRIVQVDPFIFPGREAQQIAQAVARQVLKQPLTIADFKAISGLSRRAAIPLLEWLDAQKITRRVDGQRVAGSNARQVVDSAP